MEKKKRDFLIIIIIDILTFISSIYFIFYLPIMKVVKHLDSQIHANLISENSSYDSDSGTMYSPIYYYEVKGVSYTCKSSISSSKSPDLSKDLVYYNSNNPSQCVTQYSTSANGVAIFVSVLFTIVLTYAIFAKNKPINKSNGTNSVNSNNNYEIDNYNASLKEHEAMVKSERIKGIINKHKFGLVFSFFYLINLPAILFLLLFTVINGSMYSQNLKAKDYTTTTAVANYSEKCASLENEEDFCVVYEFEIKGDTYTADRYVSTSSMLDDKTKIYYDEANPENYLFEENLLPKSAIVGFYFQLFGLIVCAILFVFVVRTIIKFIKELTSN